MKTNQSRIFNFSELDPSKEGLKRQVTQTLLGKSSSLPKLTSFKHIPKTSRDLELNNSTILANNFDCVQRVEGLKQLSIVDQVREHRQVAIENGILKRKKSFKDFYCKFVDKISSSLIDRTEEAKHLIDKLKDDFIQSYKISLNRLNQQKEVLRADLEVKSTNLVAILCRNEQIKFTNQNLRNNIRIYADYRAFMVAVQNKCYLVKNSSKPKFKFLKGNLKKFTKADPINIMKGVDKVIDKDEEMKQPVFEDANELMEIIKHLEGRLTDQMIKLNNLASSSTRLINYDQTKEDTLLRKSKLNESVVSRLSFEHDELESIKKRLTVKKKTAAVASLSLDVVLFDQIRTVFLNCVSNCDLVELDKPLFFEYVDNPVTKHSYTIEMLNFIERFLVKLSNSFEKERGMNTKLSKMEKQIENESLAARMQKSRELEKREKKAKEEEIIRRFTKVYERKKMKSMPRFMLKEKKKFVKVDTIERDNNLMYF